MKKWYDVMGNLERTFKMILSCQNISKAFIVDEILKDINLTINKGDKVALVGINGAGKTTLFRIITGDLLADEGQVILSNDVTLGYLKQNALNASDNTLYAEVYGSNQKILSLQSELKALEDEIHNTTDHKTLYDLNHKYDRQRLAFEQLDGYQYDSLVKGVLTGLGFNAEDYSQPVSTLSGGQKTRIALAMELIKAPDILMLDEPTNHLDIDAITWLESYLQNYRGTLLIISHDRYFLDQVTNKTVELEFGRANVYPGNYSDFMVLKAHNQEVQEKHYVQQQRAIKKQEDVIKQLRSFNREKSIKRAESREKQLEKVVRIEKPQSVQANMHLKLVPRVESGFDVLNVNELSKSFDDLTLFENISFEIKKGEKVALIGDNGSGKSTLFKIINKVIAADHGEFKPGAKVKIGYYDQEHQLLNPNNSLIDEITDAYPTMTTGEIRNVLASYLFKGDEVFKRVSTLSGGEKGRLTLVKLMLSESNFLILDEPTNHLDIISKNILENALKGYEGTIFFISHDRYFVNQIADKVLHLSNKDIKTYIGNYDYFIEQKARQDQTISQETEAVQTENKLSWIEEKNRKAELRRLETKFEAIEVDIHQLEEAVVNYEEQLADEAVYTDHVKASEISEAKEKAEAMLETLYSEWEVLHEAIEEYR